MENAGTHIQKSNLLATGNEQVLGNERKDNKIGGRIRVDINYAQILKSGIVEKG